MIVFLCNITEMLILVLSTQSKRGWLGHQLLQNARKNKVEDVLCANHNM